MPPTLSHLWHIVPPFADITCDFAIAVSEQTLLRRTLLRCPVSTSSYILHYTPPFQPISCNTYTVPSTYMNDVSWHEQTRSNVTLPRNGSRKPCLQGNVRRHTCILGQGDHILGGSLIGFCSSLPYQLPLSLQNISRGTSAQHVPVICVHATYPTLKFPILRFIYPKLRRLQSPFWSQYSIISAAGGKAESAESVMLPYLFIRCR